MAGDTSPRVLRALEAAEGYLQLGMAVHAHRELNSIREADQLPEYRKLRGFAHREQQEYAAALDELKQALAHDEADLDVLMGMAWCYKRVDRLPQAIAAMEQAYQHHRDEPIVLYNLACYYSLAGRKMDALAWLGRALRMRQDLKRLIQDESDFDPLRHDADFLHLMSLVNSTPASRD